MAYKSNNKSRKGNQKKDYRKPNSKGSHNTDKQKDEMEEEGKTPVNPTSRNHYLWYYFDEAIADQVSRLSFQQLGDMPFNDPFTSQSYKVPAIQTVYLNPCPGVQLASQYSSATIQKSAINLSGFRLFEKIAAFTGRTQTYGPQDVSTMELIMGELISQFEFIRRAFGVAFASNMRNRAYPKRVLEAMGVDANDLAINFANYRTQFNMLVTRANQIPIPLEVAYFEKCASLYESYYTDSESPMAQIIIPVMGTTWKLDETSYSGGTVLVTEPWCLSKTGTNLGTQMLSVYLTTLSNTIDDLMNSSTLNVVYTDLINLATKINMSFWKFDYLLDGYLVLPEYNQKYLLQYHNFTYCPHPASITTLDAVNGITPFNDVYPNPAANALYYNPGITRFAASVPGVPYSAIIDSPVGELDTESRCNITRYVCVSSNTPVTSGGTTVYIDNALPDHYATYCKIWNCDNTDRAWRFSYIDDSASGEVFKALSDKFDWGPIFRHVDSNNTVDSLIFGDLNYYTLVDWTYVRKLHDFVGLALYDFRVGRKDG